MLVKFERLQLKASDIPDLEGLSETFRWCAKYWKDDEKATAFFKRAERLAKQDAVTALRIGDYNTTGLLGGDRDRSNNWYNLIKCSGSSSKWAGEGGSFGIGKNAPFAASRMRTVFYSTLNKDGEHAFQGVARLVTHERTGVGTVQQTGYLGNARGGSIRERKKIPRKYVRSEQGTDLIILGYEADSSWSSDLIHSVLENFWPAIHFGDLEVMVNDTKIAKKNLKSLLESYSGEEDFTAHLYYKAFVDAEAKAFSKKLPTLKDATVKLLAGNPDLPKKVAMVRKTGMVIYQRPFRSVVPFCGVFLCRNEEGNRLLREMEPPRHDEWDADHPEKGAHKKTADELAGYIRDCIKELAPVDGQKVLVIPELSQFLPDDDDSPEESFEGNPDEGLSRHEGFDRKPEERKIEGRKIERNRRATETSKVQPGEGDLETEGGAGGTSGNGGGGGAGGGNKSGEGDTNQPGRPDGNDAKPPVPVPYRAFPRDLKTGTYLLTLQPTSDTKAAKLMLSVSAVGDDATTAIDFASASLPNGKKLLIPRSGMIGPVTFPSRGPLRIEVVLKDPRRLALEVEAHEAE